MDPYQAICLFDPLRWTQAGKCEFERALGETLRKDVQGIICWDILRFVTAFTEADRRGQFPAYVLTDLFSDGEVPLENGTPAPLGWSLAYFLRLHHARIRGFRVLERRQSGLQSDIALYTTVRRDPAPSLDPLILEIETLWPRLKSPD